jgi:hypothetical protein
MTEVAVFVWTRSQLYLGNLPIGFCLQAMLMHFRNTLFSKGRNTLVFDEPDPGVGDRDIVRQLNRALAIDPEADLPKGYKRVMDNELSVIYRFPDCLPVSDGYQATIETLD